MRFSETLTLRETAYARLGYAVHQLPMEPEGEDLILFFLHYHHVLHNRLKGMVAIHIGTLLNL